MLRLSGDSRVMSRPPTDIAPLTTATKPQIALSNVVLPQPDEPRSAMNSPPCGAERDAIEHAMRAVTHAGLVHSERGRGRAHSLRAAPAGPVPLATRSVS